MPTLAMSGTGTSTITLARSVPLHAGKVTRIRSFAAGLEITGTSFVSDVLPPAHITLELVEGETGSPVAASAPVQVLADGWARSDATLIDWVRWQGSIVLDSEKSYYAIPGNTGTVNAPLVRVLVSGLSTSTSVVGLLTYEFEKVHG